MKLKLVVNGPVETVTVSPRWKIATVRDQAMHRNGYGMARDWDVRTEQGVVLEPSISLASAGVKDGDTLFINPSAGYGG